MTHQGLVQLICIVKSSVTNPTGPAIGCSKYTRCDITWKVVLENDPCPCAFNISCCTNGLMLSFWWNWDLLEIPRYRYILDFGGIYNFYNPQNAYRAMSYRIYGSTDRQWFNNIPPKFGAWQHVVILVQSKKMTVYLDGRFYMDRGLTSARNSWFSGAKTLTPRLFDWLWVLTPCATYRDSLCSMPHKARSSLKPALGHEMPPLLQVASDVFIRANGCNIPFQLGLQMTSNIQCS